MPPQGGAREPLTQCAPTATNCVAFTSELRNGRELTSEQFGPILHVVRFKSGELEAVLEAIRASGYGLTLGVQTRLESTWQRVYAATAVGNTALLGTT